MAIMNRVSIDNNLGIEFAALLGRSSLRAPEMLMETGEAQVKVQWAAI
jgi:hypothetical protein